MILLEFVDHHLYGIGAMVFLVAMAFAAAIVELVD